MDSLGDIAGFSSDGPTAERRTKPEVLARGVDTQTVASLDDAAYVGVSGTSLSTPLVASTVACLIQAHPTWTVEQRRRYRMHTASEYILNGEPDPLFVRGFGVIDALAALAGVCVGGICLAFEGVKLQGSVGIGCGRAVHGCDGVFLKRGKDLRVNTLNGCICGNTLYTVSSQSSAFRVFLCDS